MVNKLFFKIRSVDFPSNDSLYQATTSSRNFDFETDWNVSVYKVKSEKPETWDEDDIFDYLRKLGWTVESVTPEFLEVWL